MTLRLAALGLALALAAAPTKAQNIPEGGPAWEPLATALAEAPADGKLIMLYTYASWCGWCTRLEQDVFAHPDVRPYIDANFHAVALDIESDEEITFREHTVPMGTFATALGLGSTPTTVFIDTDGDLITKLPGYHEHETFRLALQFVRDEAYETTTFEAYLEAHHSGHAGHGYDGAPHPGEDDGNGEAEG